MEHLWANDTSQRETHARLTWEAFYERSITFGNTLPEPPRRLFQTPVEG